jgi:hypothetical protein
MAGLFSLLGALALAAPAHAQFGGFQQQQLGTPVAMHMQDLPHIVIANVLNGRQLNFNFIAAEQTAIGNRNSQVAIFGVQQGNLFNRQPAQGLYVPAGPVLERFKQVNLNRVHVNQTAIGNRNTQVADVAVAQNNYATAPEGNYRYLLAPVGPGLNTLLQINANVVVITQLAIGNGNTQVALVGVAQQNASQLKIPAGPYGNLLLQINKNVSVVTQVAVGNGNSQVAIVNVGQQNG